jgi:hypothetical protein
LDIETTKKEEGVRGLCGPDYATGIPMETFQRPQEFRRDRVAGGGINEIPKYTPGWNLEAAYHYSRNRDGELQRSSGVP